MQKLPVIAVIKEALCLVWQRRARLAVALCGLTLLMCVIDVAASHLLRDVETSWLDLVIALINFFAVVLFTVTCHRVILLDDDAVPRYGIHSWSPRETRFLGWMLAGIGLCIGAIFAMWLVTRAIPLALASIVEVWGALILIGVITGAYLFSRVSMLLPATALDQRHDMEWAWSITKNNDWRLTFIVAAIPVLNVLPFFHLDGDNILLDIATTFAGYVVMSIEIALLSVAYRHLNAMQVESMPKAD